MTRGRRRDRVADAIAELADLRTTDPAAAAAVDAMKLTQFTLETWWVGRLDEAAPPRRHGA